MKITRKFDSTKAVDFFNKRLTRFKAAYSKTKLMDKIGTVARKGGIPLIYQVLLLYYAMTDSVVPTHKKLIVVAALGYFIAPVDLMPDFIPTGLIDDAAILAFALKQVAGSIDPFIENRAKAKLHDWFGDFDDSALKPL